MHNKSQSAKSAKEKVEKVNKKMKIGAKQEKKCNETDLRKGNIENNNGKQHCQRMRLFKLCY